MTKRPSRKANYDKQLFYSRWNTILELIITKVDIVYLSLNFMIAG